MKKYNALVDEMTLLARAGKKPSARTRLPRKLDSKKLFRLDVDDDIWQDDPGLGPQGENSDVQRWQVDDDVRRGILARLEQRRCEEEMERVSAEVQALAQWSYEEERALRDFLASGSGAHGRRCVPTFADVLFRHRVVDSAAGC